MFLKKMNSLKKGEEIPLLNFREFLGPTFKLRGWPRVPRSRVPGSWSHVYTMPESTTSAW